MTLVLALILCWLLSLQLTLIVVVIHVTCVKAVDVSSVTVYTRSKARETDVVFFFQFR